MANRVARVIGMAESNEHFLSLALFQGQARPDVVKAVRLGDASRKVSSSRKPASVAFKADEQHRVQELCAAARSGS